LVNSPCGGKAPALVVVRDTLGLDHFDLSKKNAANLTLLGDSATVPSSGSRSSSESPNYAAAICDLAVKIDGGLQMLLEFKAIG